MTLKLLTLNLHCFAETKIQEKQKAIANKILDYDIDVVFLQEVAQTKNAETISGLVKTDNYAWKLLELLKAINPEYQLFYIPFKIGFNIYEEGLGIISKHPLINKSSKYISQTRDFANWKTRKLLRCELYIEESKVVLATTHFGWTDENEIFEKQFDLATEDFDKASVVIMGGDFNITPDSQEYEFIKTQGWTDIFIDNKSLFHEPTFNNKAASKAETLRIDYIIVNNPFSLINGEILFKDHPVSDHYGVYAEISI